MKRLLPLLLLGVGMVGCAEGQTKKPNASVVKFACPNNAQSFVLDNKGALTGGVWEFDPKGPGCTIRNAHGGTIKNITINGVKFSSCDETKNQETVCHVAPKETP